MPIWLRGRGLPTHREIVSDARFILRYRAKLCRQALALGCFFEADVCEKLNSPVLAQADWDTQTQWLREFPLRAGRVVVRGRMASRDASTVLHADDVLHYKENILCL